MNERAARIANLSPEQRRLLELMLQERDQAGSDEAIPALPRRSESEQPVVFPLSFQQLWFIDVSSNVTRAVRLRGPLDVAALEASLREICVRHEVLRTTFGTSDGEPVQMVGPPRPVSLTRVDLRELPPPAREAEANRLLIQEAKRPFDLSRDMMLRGTLLRLADEEHVLLLMLHHIVSDGWSLNVLFRELGALYNALRCGERANLPELPVQYADYAVWQRLQDEGLRQTIEWKEKLADAPKILDTPTDRLRPPRQTWRGAWQKMRMPAWLLRELRALCQQQNATLFMTLLAAWVALLHRYSGEDDILIGTPFANRNRVEVEGLIGLFANIPVLRHDLTGDPSFAELLVRVRETAVDAFSHGELPFKKLVDELHLKIQFWFFLQKAARSSLKLDGLQVEQIKIDRGGISPFLALTISEGDNSLTARLDYNADLFKPATIARMLQSFRALLESVVADPEQHVSKLPIKLGVSWRARLGKRLRRAIRYIRRWFRRTRRWLRRTARRTGRASVWYLAVGLRRAGLRRR